jgi:hypothetical protein
MADQMATHLSCADEWRLTLTFDLDLRETMEDVMARQTMEDVMARQGRS